MSANPAALAYPRSRHGPAPLVDLSDPAVRDRLGPGAVKAFFRLVDLWQLRDEDWYRIAEQYEVPDEEAVLGWLKAYAAQQTPAIPLTTAATNV